MKNRFDLIIFDWDGTLVDSVDWIVHCIQQAAAHCGCLIPEPQAIKDIIGLSLENAINQLFPDLDVAIRRQIEMYYAQIFFSKPMDLFPGVKPMLQQLRSNGFKLAIATGKKASGLALATAEAGVSELFCATRGSDQTASKPNPLMIDEIVTELSVDKQRALMVGDSAHDLQMAINAGVASVGVTCGAHSAAKLQQYQPLLCLEYSTDLLAHLGA